MGITPPIINWVELIPPIGQQFSQFQSCLGGIPKELNKELNVDVRNNFCTVKHILSTRGDARYFSVPSFRVLWGGVAKKTEIKKLNLDVRNLFAGSHIEPCCACCCLTIAWKTLATFLFTVVFFRAFLSLSAAQRRSEAQRERHREKERRERRGRYGGTPGHTHTHTHTERSMPLY